MSPSAGLSSMASSRPVSYREVAIRSGPMVTFLFWSPWPRQCTTSSGKCSLWPCEDRANTPWPRPMNLARHVFDLWQCQLEGLLIFNCLQGVLPLWEACRQSGQPVEFVVSLRDKGKAAGTLYGHITVKWEDQRAERQTRVLSVSFADGDGTSPQARSPTITRRPSPPQPPQSPSPNGPRRTSLGSSAPLPTAEDLLPLASSVPRLRTRFQNEGWDE